MSVVSAALVLVVLVLGAFVHRSGAIRCYVCISRYDGYCDDPLDTDNDSVHKYTCPSSYNACWRGHGSAMGKITESSLLVRLIQTWNFGILLFVEVITASGSGRGCLSKSNQFFLIRGYVAGRSFMKIRSVILRTVANRQTERQTDRKIDKRRVNAEEQDDL